MHPRTNATPGCTWPGEQSVRLPEGSPSSTASQAAAPPSATLGAAFYENRVDLPVASSTSAVGTSATAALLMTSSSSSLLPIVSSSSAASIVVPSGPSSSLSPDSSKSDPSLSETAARPLPSDNSTMAGGATPGYTPGTFAPPHIVMYAEGERALAPKPLIDDQCPSMWLHGPERQTCYQSTGSCCHFGRPMSQWAPE